MNKMDISGLNHNIRYKIDKYFYGKAYKYTKKENKDIDLSNLYHNLLNKIDKYAHKYSFIKVESDLFWKLFEKRIMTDYKISHYTYTKIEKTKKGYYLKIGELWGVTLGPYKKDEYKKFINDVDKYMKNGINNYFYKNPNNFKTSGSSSYLKIRTKSFNVIRISSGMEGLSFIN